MVAVGAEEVLLIATGVVLGRRLQDVTVIMAAGTEVAIIRVATDLAHAHVDESGADRLILMAPGRSLRRDGKVSTATEVVYPMTIVESRSLAGEGAAVNQVM